VLPVNQSNIIQQSGGTITISQATSANAGYYQCMANNIYGTAVTDVAFIQVVDRESINIIINPRTTEGGGHPPCVF